jgi:hypothetical protein
MFRLLKTCSLRSFGLRSLAVGALAFVPALASAAPFTNGSVVVNRYGDGVTALTSAATQISIMEFTTTGSSVQTIVFGTTAPDPQTDSGSATSAGFFNVHNGYLSVPGQNNNFGTVTVTSSNTKVNSTLDMSGTVVNRTLFPTGGPSGSPPSPFSGNNFRSSIATSGSTFYSVGTSSGSPNTGGAWYFDGTSFNSITTSGTPANVSNIRTVEIFNNQLYFASSSGTFLGVSSLGTGLPTSGTQTPSLVVNAGVGASTYGFVMFSTGSQGAGVLDLAYLADDRTAAGGGLQKYTFNGSAWTNSWTLLVGASGTTTLQTGTGAGFAGIRGLAGSYDSLTGAATLFATTSGETTNNRLISILDSGSTTPSSYTTLASAGSNFVFRGVDLIPVPVPEPSTLVLAGIGIGAAGWTVMRRRSPRRPSA